MTAAWTKAFAPLVGGHIIGEEFIPLSVSEFSQVIARIQQAKPDWVMTLLVGQNHHNYYPQAAAAGLKYPMASTVNMAQGYHLHNCAGNEAPAAMPILEFSKLLGEVLATAVLVDCEEDCRIDSRRTQRLVNHRCRLELERAQQPAGCFQSDDGDERHQDRVAGPGQDDGLHEVGVKQDQLRVLDGITDDRGPVEWIGGIDLQSESRQRPRQHRSAAVGAVEDDATNTAEILNQWPSHLTALRLGGRGVDEVLNSCHTRYGSGFTGRDA